MTNSAQVDASDDTLFSFRPHAFELLKGAIDLHVHGYPEVSLSWLNRGPDRATAALAQAYGMSGWVLKSHLYPTVDRANRLQEDFQGTDFSVYGSITLNPIVGGISPTVVELAVTHGAKVIFLPTWGARSDVKPESYVLKVIGHYVPSVYEYADATALKLIGDDHKLTSSVIDVIEACKDLNVALATGHIALEESRAIAEYCKSIGYSRLIVTHPLHYASRLEDVVELADLGAFIEFNNAPLFHPDNADTIKEMYAGMVAVGSTRSVMTSDVWSGWAPPAPECLRIFAEQIAYLGAKPEDIRTMLIDNPRRLLGL